MRSQICSSTRTFRSGRTRSTAATCLTKTMGPWRSIAVGSASSTRGSIESNWARGAGLNGDRPRDTCRRGRPPPWQRLRRGRVDELRDGANGGLTLRNVARRAGVAPGDRLHPLRVAEHLITELFWRRLSAMPEDSD